MFGHNKKKKKSFFEKLTGSVHVDDELDDDFDIIDNSQVDYEDHSHTEHNDQDLETDEDRLPDDEAGQLAVDVFNMDNEIIIKTMVAGVKPNDLDIDITRDMITIHGTRESAEEVEENDYYHKELYWGSFTRNVLLPEEIDVEEAEAVEKHGLLTIKLPKLDKNRKAKLHVKSK